MIRPLPSLERLFLDEREDTICYRYGKGAEEVEWMDYLESIARVTSHIPDKGQVTFVGERPPPPHIAYQEILTAAEASAEYFP
jgi:hypothetical protein